MWPTKKTRKSFKTMALRVSETTTIFVQTIIMIVLLFGLGLLLKGCTDKCETTKTYVYYEPVYTTVEEIRSSVKLQDPVDIQNPGKIYLYGSFIFIGEADKGIHVVDNSNPEAPENIAFLNIPGNADMAISNNVLYADSYMDLVLFDISDTKTIKTIDIVKDVLNSYTNMGFMVSSEMGVITDWKEVKTVENYDSDCGGSPDLIRFNRGFLATPEMDFLNMANTKSNAAPSPGSNTGVGGSMARFTLHDNFLFAVNHSELNVININDPENSVKENTVFLGGGIETIFPYNNNLFIGSQSGIHIYDITTPSEPAFLSTFAHVTSCDPVVVEDEFAYVTLRSGTECDGFTNQLDVLDISDLTNPKLIKTYPMENPHGLGIKDNTLFVCEGEYGLKIYDSTDKLHIDENMIEHFKDLHAYDVIPNGEVLILIGKDGLYQYNYQNLENIKLLSFLPIISQ